MPHAWVMVLGDVGRSPRMQYHASSLCKTVRMRLRPSACLLLPAPTPLLPPALVPGALERPGLCVFHQAPSAVPLFCYLQPGYEVTLIGYRGAALIEELKAPATDGRLSLAYLPDL